MESYGKQCGLSMCQVLSLVQLSGSIDLPYPGIIQPQTPAVQNKLAKKNVRLRDTKPELQ